MEAAHEDEFSAEILQFPVDRDSDAHKNLSPQKGSRGRGVILDFPKRKPKDPSDTPGEEGYKSDVPSGNVLPDSTGEEGDGDDVPSSDGKIIILWMAYVKHAFNSIMNLFRSLSKERE